MNTLRKAMEKEIKKLKPVLFATYNAIVDYQTDRRPEKEEKLRILIRETAEKMKPFITHIPEYKQRFIKGLLALEETELSIREEIFLLDEAVAEMHIRLRRDDRSQREKNQPWTEDLLALLNKKRNHEIDKDIGSTKGEIDGNNRPDKIKGLGIETGNVEGQVQIIMDSNNFSQLQRGRILVTTMTTPDLFSYFGRLKGIITEQGGRLCHAAILAREFDIPCVVGCEGVAEVLEDGDKVRLDSDKGEILM